MLRYPAHIRKDDDGFMVSFLDIPEALTSGATREEALDMALDALETAMDFYFDERRAIPLPSKLKKGQVAVELSVSTSGKVLLLNEMIRQRITPAALARKLGTQPQNINRLVNLHYRTKIDTIAEAFEAMDKRLTFAVE